MQELYNKLEMVLSNTTVPEFSIVVNHKPIVLRERGKGGKEISRLGKVRLNKVGKRKTLQIGCRREVNNQTSMVTDERVVELIKEEIYNFNIAGIDFSGIATSGYQIDYDTDLRVVFIITPLHRRLLDILKSESEKGIQLSTTTGKTLNLTLAEIRRFKDEYLTEMYIRYRDTYQDILARKLSSPRSYKYRNLQFYKTGRAFVPVLIEGSFIFNPLTEVPFIFKFFKETDFYKACQEHGSVQVSNIAIYYLTHLEICRALHLERYMEFNAPFTIALLFAPYIPGIADENTLVYRVRKEYSLDVKEKVIHGDFMHMYEDIAYMYEPVTSLYFACYSRTKRDDIATTLYDIVRGYSL